MCRDTKAHAKTKNKKKKKQKKKTPKKKQKHMPTDELLLCLNCLTYSNHSGNIFKLMFLAAKILLCSHSIFIKMTIYT